MHQYPLTQRSGHSISCSVYHTTPTPTFPHSRTHQLIKNSCVTLFTLLISRRILENKKVDIRRLSRLDRYWSGCSWETARWTLHQYQREDFWGVCCHLLMTDASWGMWGECRQKREGRWVLKCPDATAKTMLHGIKLTRHCHFLRWQQLSPYFTLPLLSSPQVSLSRCPAAPPATLPPIYTPTRPTAHPPQINPAHCGDSAGTQQWTCTLHDDYKPLTSSCSFHLTFPFPNHT